jgi:hypothetical protein
MSKPIDVVIMCRPSDDKDKFQRCLKSLSNEPVNIYIIDGIEGCIGKGRYNSLLTGTEKWVSFVDPDDEVIPGIYNKLLQYDADVVYCNELIIGEESKRIHYGWSSDPSTFEWIPERFRSIFWDKDNSTYFHHRGIFKRDSALQHATMLSNKHECAEIHLMREMQDAGKKIVHCQEYGYIWKIHGKNTVLLW